jgi:hypothetical protein
VATTSAPIRGSRCAAIRAAWGATARARDEQSAARLWAASEELTGVRYAALA